MASKIPNLGSISNEAYITTNSKRNLFLLNPNKGDIDINDIALSLSNKCRFNGHSDLFYSVAEHSYIISLIVKEQSALWALLHDATEAYLPDVVRGCKESLYFRDGDGLFIPFYDIENTLLFRIMSKYGLDWPEPDDVKYVDTHIVGYEAMICYNEKPDWVDSYYWQPFKNVLLPCWNPEQAKEKFLERFNELSNGKNY